MKKINIFIILLLSSFNLSANVYTFKLQNNAFQSISTEETLNIGVINYLFCSSPGLNLSAIGEGVTNASCYLNLIGSYKKMTLIIPYKIIMQTTSSVDVFFSINTPSNQFNSFEMKNSRNGTIGGGLNLINSSINMTNNQEILGEFEIDFYVTGPDAKSLFQQEISIDLTPEI